MSESDPVPTSPALGETRVNPRGTTARVRTSASGAAPAFAVDAGGPDLLTVDTSGLPGLRAGDVLDSPATEIVATAPVMYFTIPDGESSVTIDCADLFGADTQLMCFGALTNALDGAIKALSFSGGQGNVSVSSDVPSSAGQGVIIYIFKQLP